MAADTFTFDPEGDLFLRLHYSDEAGVVKVEGCTASSRDASSEEDVVLIPVSNDMDVSPPEDASKTVHMLVSSKHLILASSVFKAMFRPGFRESLPRVSEGQMELDLPDDDPAAFEILLNIIHGHVRKVPDKITLEMLIKLSVLVDKYQVLEVTELHVRSWMPKLRLSLPTEFSPSVICLMSISWVFKMKENFKELTSIAERGSSFDLGEDDQTSLLIPRFITDRIEATRQNGISILISDINNMITAYNTGSFSCTTVFSNNEVMDGNLACDGMVLGSLMKSLASYGLWPLPTAPYVGISMESLANQIRSLKILALCDQDRFQACTWRTDHRPGHGWKTWLSDKADSALFTADGQDLSDMTAQSNLNRFGPTEKLVPGRSSTTEDTLDP
ncbi:uncharacterized protein LY89DRAFT_96922 [Mollisia scopiformis]|uniref:Uncharacterized protein n=1 Tax=Mollisia scopiformis TaxID=149040 RepID=A0A194X7N7_MOLSC|nr:uncharacterized protein LY89DRAFT_96922 [Mollisia scopiformis]KUJ15812.1 hypothetical protein LY89DRAFT_96922 [Mollisia scopiformis]